ncbi:hypothetical protein TWF696_004628 [Orbilia brochopaga]|uniref:SCP domain-containing protein n=1 Tax=Orbilia brochopaga TaxID=3140254 RepID=A0AAV9V7H7_9PEZI
MVNFLHFLLSILMVITTTTSIPTNVLRYTSDLESSALKMANIYRKEHNATALEWNATMAEYALSRAIMYAIGNTNERSKYAEIISLSDPVSLWDPRLHIRDWRTSGIKRYNFTHPVVNKVTKRFTQLVWKNTKRMGCAWVSGGKPWQHQLRCEFWPPGNIGFPNSYLANVKPLETKQKPPTGISNYTMDVDDLMTSYHIAAFGSALILERLERLRR